MLIINGAFTNRTESGHNNTTNAPLGIEMDSQLLSIQKSKRRLTTTPKCLILGKLFNNPIYLNRKQDKVILDYIPR